MLSEKMDIFVEAADALCFSDVAKSRYTTQPTISRQISALEAEWGIKLFVRTNKGLRLTPEGSIMLSCCKKMQQLCENSLERAKDLKVRKQDRLRLGFLETFDVERIFMPYLQEFSDRYPELELSVSSHSFRELRKGLETREFDIIYTYDFELPRIREDVVADYLTELTCFFALSEKHPLYSKADLSLRDCEGETYFLPEPSDTVGRELDLKNILHAEGVANCRIRFVPNLASLYLQMQMGKGIALLDESVAGIRDPRYRLLRLQKVYKPLGLISVWRKDNLNPFLSLFVNSQKLAL